MEVGYLGPDNTTFGYMATEQYFGRRRIETIAFPTHAAICQAVGAEEVTLGVVATENVVDGIVNETVYGVEDVFRKFGVRVIGETELPIELFYLKKNNDGTRPDKVLSHAKGIGQCRQFIGKLRQEGIVVEVRNSTGEAAKEASSNPQFAAIASARAEKVYGLARISEDSVVDNKNSFTRFWVLGKQMPQPTGQDKTCLLINLEQPIPGGLAKSLVFFAERGVNLLVVYPIPIKGRKWEYTFFLEFNGHLFDQPMREAYEALEQSGICLGGPLVLGSYPAAARP